MAAGGCALSSSCRDSAAAAVGRGATAFVRDPGRALRSAGGALVEGVKGAVGGAAERVGTAWRTGNFRELGRVTGEVGVSFVPIGGLLAKAGSAARSLTAGRLLRGASELAGASRAVRAGESVGARMRSGVGRVCANSFLAATLVLTPAGMTPIADLAVGDQVLATDPVTGTVTARTVTARFVNDDPVTGTVVIDGEPLGTTPEHPFYTEDRGWVLAQDLRPGDHVRSADGSQGVVSSVSWTGGRSVMYNLTVAVDHTYFVGDGRWLVHNCDEALQPRDALGRWTGPGARAGERAEEAVWDAIDAKPGWTANRGRVTVRDASGRARVCDGMARSPLGRIIGLETKSGTARRNAWQRTFDRGVSKNSPAIAVGRYAGDKIRRVLLFGRRME